jgi:hypothetical protein
LGAVLVDIGPRVVGLQIRLGIVVGAKDVVVLPAVNRVGFGGTPNALLGMGYTSNKKKSEEEQTFHGSGCLI